MDMSTHHDGNSKRPLRVLFVSCETSTTSGVGRCIADLLTHLDRDRIEPILVTDWPGVDESTILAEVSHHGVPVIHRDLGRWYPPRAAWGVRHLVSFLKTLRTRVWALMHLIQEHRIDLVYTNALPTPDAALAAWLSGVPHIWHLHEAVCGNQYLRAYLPCLLVKLLIRRFSSRVVFVSDQKAREFSAGRGMHEIRVIHNGVDLERFSCADTESQDLRADLGLGCDIRIVVTVGIVSSHKGHDTLIEAAEEVLRAIPNVAFIFAGPELDDFGDRLRLRIKELGIDEKVIFLGPRGDIPDILRQSDLLVLASTQEAFALVLVEAMASGKPVVATRCGGPEEIVVDGITGHLVNVGDVALIAERIKAVLSNLALSKRMGTEGRRRVEEKFSVDTYSKSIQDVIQETYLTHSGINK